MKYRRLHIELLVKEGFQKGGAGSSSMGKESVHDKSRYDVVLFM